MTWLVIVDLNDLRRMTFELLDDPCSAYSTLNESSPAAFASIVLAVSDLLPDLDLATSGSASTTVHVRTNLSV